MAVGCAKSILISFNLILWLSGGTLLVLGSWIFIDSSKAHLFHFITSNDIKIDFAYYMAYMLLALGGFILFTGLCGCCGALKENRLWLGFYFSLLFLLMCAELAAAILTILYKDNLLLGLEDKLTEGLKNNYGYKNTTLQYISFSEAIDFAQFKFKCCGIKSDEDYLNSKWWNESLTFTERRNVPPTCCVVQDPGEVEEPWQNPYIKDDLGCQDSRDQINSKSRNKQGCIRNIEAWFLKETTVLITVGISSAALEVVGMIFAICLCRGLRADI